MEFQKCNSCPKCPDDKATHKFYRINWKKENMGILRQRAIEIIINWKKMNIY